MRQNSFLLRSSVLLAVIFSLIGFSPDADILAQRMNPPAVIPVGNNFKIKGWTSDEGYYGKPSIAFDGANFLIVWCQDTAKNNQSHCTSIYAARVNPSGSMVDIQGIAVSTSNQEVGTPSVVFDGSNFILFWSGMRGDIYEIYSARIRPDGTIVDPEGVVLTNGADPKPYRMIGVAFDGANTLVTFRTNNDNVFAMRITRQLSNLDAPAGFIVAGLNVHYYPSVAFDGTNFMVVWHDGRHNAFEELDIYGARVTKSGQVLDPNGFPIHVAPGFADHRTIGFDGQNYWVAWFEQNPIYGSTFHGKVQAVRVSPSGAVLDSPPVLISDHVYGQNAPQLACQNGYCLVVWFMGLDNGGADNRLMDVFAERLGQDGQVLDSRPIPVSTSVGNQWGPNVGYGGGHFLVAWKELNSTRGAPASLWGQILEEQDISASPDWLNRAAVVQELQSNSPINWVKESVEPQPYQNFSYLGDGIAFDLDHSYVFNNGVMKVNQNGYWKSDHLVVEGNIFAAWGKSASHFWIGGWCGVRQEYNHPTWRDWICYNKLGGQDDDLLVSGLWGPGDQLVWASTDGGKLIHYDSSIPYDGPRTPAWRSLSSGQPYDLRDMWGAAANDVYAVGERGTIVHYNGSQWESLPKIPTNQTLSAIWGSGPDDIFVVGDWGVILHYDGLNWTEQDSGIRLHLYDVWGFDGRNVYAVGQNGTILHYEGTTWTTQNSGVTFDLQTVWGAQGIKDDQVVKAVWAAGDELIVLKSITTSPALHFFLPMTKK